MVTSISRDTGPGPLEFMEQLAERSCSEWGVPAELAEAAVVESRSFIWDGPPSRTVLHLGWISA